MREIPKEPKAQLKRYLQTARDALVWKLEGLSEYDVRRPMVRSGTNLLGLVKHVAMVEAGYLGDTFGRPYPQKFAALAEDAEPNADMWATVEETREEIVDLYRRVWAHSDQTIDSLDLDATGHVAWWGEGNVVTLHLILIHMIDETNRHAGQADIVRELIDGAIGLGAANSNVPDLDEAWWTGYRDRLEEIAASFKDS